MRGNIEDKRSPGVMKAGVGAMDSGGAGGGKRGDACLAEIQRLEKNRANRRNRMEKARFVLSSKSETARGNAERARHRETFLRQTTGSFSGTGWRKR